MAVIPDWLEPIRIIGTLLIWLIFPAQLWSLYFNRKQYKQWAEDEAERRQRWKADMAAITAMREEAYHLRAQAEVALAQARQHLPKGKIDA